MGCAADLTRGQITDKEIQALACIVDNQLALFSGNILDGNLDPIFSQGMTVTYIGTGVFSVLLDEAVPPGAAGVPKISVSVSIPPDGAVPMKYEVFAPSNIPNTAFTVRTFSAGVLTDPDWMSISVHK